MVVDPHVAVVSRNHKMQVSLLDLTFQNQMKVRRELSLELADGRHMAIEDYMANLDSLGVDQIVGHCPVGASAIESAMEMNDILAAVAKDYPGKFSGLGGLPLLAPQHAIGEMRRAVNTLGLKGFFVYPQYAELPYDSPTLLPLYEEASKLGTILFFHTKLTPAYYDSPLNPTLDNMYRVMKSGFLSKAPNAKIVFAHLGGSLVFYKDLLETWGEGKGSRAEEYRSVLERAYWDITPSHLWSERMIKWVIDSVGEDRIIFGTNYPLFDGLSGVKQSIEHIKSLSIPQSTKSKILDENARKLFGL